MFIPTSIGISGKKVGGSYGESHSFLFFISKQDSNQPVHLSTSCFLLLMIAYDASATFVSASFFRGPWGPTFFIKPVLQSTNFSDVTQILWICPGYL